MSSKQNPSESDTPQGSFLAIIHSRNAQIRIGPDNTADDQYYYRRSGEVRQVECGPSDLKKLDWPSLPRFVIHSDLEKIHIQRFIKPAWANAVGRDRFGLWASFKVKSNDYATVVQKLRWVSPGMFKMGSPEDEPGRYDDEGPQHVVEITQGYWLFDTPVTQALYDAVTGKNPSRFKSAQRPVEQVSWEDAQQFIQKLNQQNPGLDLSLPTEILGENNAPVLDKIAWYGGNSGVDYDLEEGLDSSGWTDKQYEHHQAGTREVKQKQANPWGLYDILGNVWEWCEDGMRDYSDDKVKDPVGPLEDGAERVLRGGSWYYYARNVRCAYRDAYSPGYADNFTGFRCARVHEARAGSERRSHSQGSVAEQRPA